MRELLSVVCAGLGIKESEVAIEEAPGEGETLVTLTLPFAAVQALDGREHRTAKALRLLLSAAAAARGTRIHVVARANN